MKRYAVFNMSCYYPAGGWDDFVGAYNDLEEAKAAAVALVTNKWEWSDVVDLQELKLAFSTRGNTDG